MTHTLKLVSLNWDIQIDEGKSTSKNGVYQYETSIIDDTLHALFSSLIISVQFKSQVNAFTIFVNIGFQHRQCIVKEWLISPEARNSISLV